MTLKEIIKELSTKIIDVRTELEFDMGRLQNAINIPLNAISENAEKIKKFDVPAVVFYCRSGNRSGQAVSYLRELGLQHVCNGGSIEDMNYLLN